MGGLHAGAEAGDAGYRQGEGRPICDPQRGSSRQFHRPHHQRRRGAGGRQVRRRSQRHHVRVEEGDRPADQVRHQHAPSRRPHRRKSENAPDERHDRRLRAGPRQHGGRQAARPARHRVRASRARLPGREERGALSLRARAHQRRRGGLLPGRPRAGGGRHVHFRRRHARVDRLFGRR